MDWTGQSKDEFKRLGCDSLEIVVVGRKIE